MGLAAGVLALVPLFLGHPDEYLAWCCFLPFAAVIALLGADRLRTRVEIGPWGVVKRSWVSGFARPWAEVRSWSVVDLRERDEDDTFNHRAVRFVVGWRRSEVREAEVYWPGFEPFLVALRTWAGDREQAAPAAAPNSTRGSASGDSQPTEGMPGVQDRSQH